MKRLPAKLIFLFVLVCLFPNKVYARDVYIIDSVLSSIYGSIRYSVIGKYKAEYKDFSGTFIYDPEKVSDSSVLLEIKSASIGSNWPVLDNIVRSQRLLDVAKYPIIVFRSKSISKKKEGFFVAGTLQLHGVSREVSFLFSMEGPYRCYSGLKYVIAKGKWVICRKDFKIIWNKLLDHGGILIGNHIAVDWEIIAFSKENKKPKSAEEYFSPSFYFGQQLSPKDTLEENILR